MKRDYIAILDKAIKQKKKEGQVVIFADELTSLIDLSDEDPAEIIEALAKYVNKDPIEIVEMFVEYIANETIKTCED